MKYNFIESSVCNMCNASVERHKLLGRRLNKSQGLRPSKKAGITTSVFHCEECNLIFSNPMPIPLDIQDHYGIPPESYWKGDYFKVNPDYFTAEIKRCKELIEFSSGMKSLDIGAGLGKCMIAMESAGFEAYGIEASVPFYERAIGKMGVSANRLQCCAFEDAKFPENYFDFITFGAILEHLYDPSKSLEIALQWLKPGGVIHVEVPSSKWLIGSLINKYYKAIGSDYVGNLSPMHVPFHLYEFDLQSFKKNGEINNYHIAFFEYYVCYTNLPKLLDPLLKSYMRKTNRGMQLCVWLKKNG
jgi:2-polyprenyl-3-methyl-5-hydroxy-6-metoxy-1,4-benzoquinol methylase